MNNNYIKSIAITYIFIFIFFSVGCGGTSSDKVLNQGAGGPSGDLSLGKIQGTVTAADTGLALSNAIVEAYQNQATTDSNGNYLLEDIPAGDHNVTVRLQGYEAEVKNAVRVFSGQCTKDINFSLGYASTEHTSNFKVLSINPEWGTGGDEISILCSGCGKIPGRVTVNGVDARIVDWNTNNDGRIKVILPTQATSGPVKVIINDDTSKETDPVNFIGRPHITSIYPDIASGGQTIAVQGYNFSPVYSRNKFQLGGKDCYTLPDDASTNNLKVTLPADARTGELTVKIVFNDYRIDGNNSMTVTVAPKLVYISPKRSLPGTPITIYGYNFGTDKSRFKILLGTYEIQASDIISFSETSATFNAPSNAIIAAGTSVEVRAQVNNAQSNPLTYTAYNNVGNTISEYGIYDFASVSSGNKLKLAQLKPNDTIVFLSTLTGNSSTNFSDDLYYYVVSASLGGNLENIPTLPASVRASEFAARYSAEQSQLSYTQFGKTAPIVRSSMNIRASMSEPASDTVDFYVRDFKSSNPYDAANDLIKKGILVASSAHALIYLEESLSGMSQTACEEIANEFDKSYSALASSFGVLEPPEGNIDAQTRIVIFLTDIVDNEGKLLYYFDPRDKNLQKVNTNGTEILFINPKLYQDDAEEFMAKLSFILHSMFYYNQRFDTAGAIYYGTDWQSNGLSMLARQQTGRGFAQHMSNDVNLVKAYLQNPEKIALNTWPEKPSDGNYGLQFLWAMYLFDRCNGWDTVIQLESGRSPTVRTGLEDIELNILGSAKPSTSGLNEFINDFYLALYCDKIGFSDSFPGYQKEKYQFESIALRGWGVNGLRGKSLSETPVNKVVYQIPPFGCSVLAYNGGNWGDLEFTIESKPDRGNFKTWVIYYSNEQLNSAEQQ